MNGIVWSLNINMPFLTLTLLVSSCSMSRICCFRAWILSSLGLISFWREVILCWNTNLVFSVCFSSLLSNVISFSFIQNTAQDILEKVHRGQIAFALLDSDFFIHHRSKFPRTKVAFDAFYPESINWLISGHKDDHFIDKIDHFFNESITKNKLNHIKELYFGHINEDQPISSRTFFSRIENILTIPKLILLD